MEPLSHHSVDSRLRFLLRIYIGLSLGLIGAVVYYSFRLNVGLVVPVFALFIGAYIGFLFSRITRLTWNEEGSKVVARIDVFGALLFGILFLFDFYWHQALVQAFQGPTVFVVTWSILAGIIIGRVLGIRGKIARILDGE